MTHQKVFQSHLAKKSLGQHFLIHQGIQDKIVESCGLRSEDVVVEIGPGKGAITERIAQRVSRMIAIEKDRALAAALHEKFDGSNVTVTEADALEYDFSSLPEGLICVGNLPYNVAAPIIERVLLSGRFKKFYAMVQLEHGERMLAVPGSKEYGSLSCFIQFYSRAKKLFEIRPSAFAPPPKIQSVFLEFDIYRPEDRPIQTVDPEQLFKLIRTVFIHRRKTILNALGPYGSKEELTGILKEAKIDEKARPEQIGLADYAKLLEQLKRLKI